MNFKVFCNTMIEDMKIKEDIGAEKQVVQSKYNNFNYRQTDTDS